MKIAITGHRPNKLDNDYDLSSQLINNIKDKILDILGHIQATEQISAKDFILITGMALGIDTLFAKIAIEQNVKFIAAIPCRNQERMWVKSSKDLYNSILNNPLATKYLVTDTEYNNSCMQIRNQWMVDNCDVLIAVWDETPGGTGNCVNYAKNKGIKIIYINPNDYK